MFPRHAGCNLDVPFLPAVAQLQGDGCMESSIIAFNDHLTSLGRERERDSLRPFSQPGL